MISASSSYEIYVGGNRRIVSSIEDILLTYLNDIINGINMAAKLYHIRLAKEISDVEKLQEFPPLLANSKEQSRRGNKILPGKNEVIAANDVIEKALSSQV